ncbi:MAG: AMP-binding protein [Rhizobiaceae bacterium]|nr:AMP-binding protein [Rhizobiaceae bacterium]
MSITALLERSALLHGDKVAIVDGDRQITYAELRDRVARLAAGLKGMGVNKGDRVGILSLNSHRYVESLFAIAWAGAIPAPLNYRLAEREIGGIVDFVETGLLIADDEHRDLARSLVSSRPRMTLVHASEKAAKGMTGYEELLTRASPADPVDLGWDDTAALFFTGGTTGLPKGVMQTHGNLISSALIYVGVFQMTNETVLLSAAGLFHVAASAVLLPALMAGGRVVLMSRFTADGFLDMVERHHATFTNGVPTMLRMITNQPGVSQRQLGSVRTLLYGGSPMQRDIMASVIDTFPNARCFNTYGQTELTSAASISAGVVSGDDLSDAEAWSTIGTALPGMEIRVVAENGGVCASDEVGELLVRGPLVMKGYYRNAEATAQTLRDGWLHTGDLARIDANGRAFLVDRKKDMIVTGGENVYSAEVEAALRLHPAVADCAVFGLPDANWGERVHALIVTKPETQATEEEISAHCRLHIAGYKCPRSMEIRTEPLPLSGAGKVAKAALRQEAMERTAESC